jgi:hypothetical protein
MMSVKTTLSGCNNMEMSIYCTGGKRVRSARLGGISTCRRCRWLVPSRIGCLLEVTRGNPPGGGGAETLSWRISQMTQLEISSGRANLRLTGLGENDLAGAGRRREDGWLLLGKLLEKKIDKRAGFGPA